MTPDLFGNELTTPTARRAPAVDGGREVAAPAPSDSETGQAVVEALAALTRLDGYAPPDLEQAHDEWGCNCGPAAFAALMDRPAADVRGHFPGFEHRGYCNATQLLAACRSFGLVATMRSALPVQPWPAKLVLIQWGGPWLMPGVPFRARCRHTHWIAVRRSAVFDVNVGFWISADQWKAVVAPLLMRETPRCDGKFYPTTAIFVGSAGAA